MERLFCMQFISCTLCVIGLVCDLILYQQIDSHCEVYNTFNCLCTPSSIKLTTFHSHSEVPFTHRSSSIYSIAITFIPFQFDLFHCNITYSIPVRFITLQFHLFHSSLIYSIAISLIPFQLDLLHCSFIYSIPV